MGLNIGPPPATSVADSSRGLVKPESDAAPSLNSAALRQRASVAKWAALAVGSMAIDATAWLITGLVRVLAFPSIPAKKAVSATKAEDREGAAAVAFFLNFFAAPLIAGLVTFLSWKAAVATLLWLSGGAVWHIGLWVAKKVKIKLVKSFNEKYALYSMRGQNARRSD